MDRNRRLMSLDALRGFDMFFIMGLSSAIAALCALWPNALTDAVATSMTHVAWDGMRHHDTIFPLFLFLAGVSFPFSYGRQCEAGYSSAAIHLRIVRRAAVLVLMGLLCNGLLRFDFANLRCASVLARIGIAWMVAALLYIHCSRKVRIVLSVVILAGYALLSKYVGAPDAVGADPLSQEGCLAGYIDRLLLPGRLYVDNRFDPEGLLSTLPAVVTAMLGIFTGELVRLPDERMSGGRKTVWMAVLALALGVAAWAGSTFVPVNKMLWSSTFVCAAGAYSVAMMALFYYIIDVRGWNGRWTTVLRVVGMNSITIFMAQRIIDFRYAARFFVGGIVELCPGQVGAAVSSTAYVVMCWLFLYFLYRKDVFLKI